MAARSITFIENPPYAVDFGQFSQQRAQRAEQRSLIQKAQGVAFGSLRIVKLFFVSVGKAGYLTLSHSGASFKHIVLGYYGSLSSFKPPSDIYLAAFKIIFWVAGMGWCFVTTTARLVYEPLKDREASRSFLRQFSGEEIDITHLATNELAIDVSTVPPAVRVDNLLAMFDEVNFTNPEEPGYMAPISRREGTTQHSCEELKKSLTQFVDYVNRRVPFLGTPPAYDTPRLLAFYQQIENAVRFAIHKSDLDLAEFRQRHGENPETYAGVALTQYKDLLETRARIPLNLAIAGKHCGARFMGEAMELYDAGNSERAMEKGTLRDNLIEILAAKRKEIAARHIQTQLGTTRIITTTTWRISGTFLRFQEPKM